MLENKITTSTGQIAATTGQLVGMKKPEF